MKNWQAAREIRTQIGVIDADLGFLKNWLPCLDGEVAVTATITPAGALRKARANHAARTAQPFGGSYGCWTNGRVVVQADRLAGKWTYAVGTRAAWLAQGSAVEVTGELQRLLRGERDGAPGGTGEGRAA